MIDTRNERDARLEDEYRDRIAELADERVRLEGLIAFDQPNPFEDPAISDSREERQRKRQVRLDEIVAELIEMRNR